MGTFERIFTCAEGHFTGFQPWHVHVCAECKSYFCANPADYLCPRCR